MRRFRTARSTLVLVTMVEHSTECRIYTVDGVQIESAEIKPTTDRVEALNVLEGTTVRTRS